MKKSHRILAIALIMLSAVALYGVVFKGAYCHVLTAIACLFLALLLLAESGSKKTGASTR